MSPPAGQQGGKGVRTSTTAVAGGSITVNVGTNDPSVSITNSSTGATVTIPVAPGKDTQIPIPNVPEGTILHVSVGKGLRARWIIVEVVSTNP